MGDNVYGRVPSSRSRGLPRKAAALSVLVVAFVLSPGEEQAQNRPDLLFKVSSRPSRPARIDGPEVMRKRYVTFDVRRAIGSATLALNLFSDKSLMIERSRTEAIGENGLLWFGEVVGKKGQVTLSAVGDVLVGNIRMGHELYEIRYEGEGIHTINEIDASAFPEECSSDAPASRVPASEAAAAILTDPCDVIDIMVVYTSAAKSAAGGHAAIQAKIYQGIGDANTTFIASNLNMRIHPVHLAEVSYMESGDVFMDRNRLQNPSDGIMDNVHILRDTYCADEVSLIVDTGTCGIGFIQDPSPDPGFENHAFFVTQDDCLGNTLAFAHELGHNLGGRHDWYVDEAIGSPTYNHGYVNVDKGWRTVMAYPNKCGDSNMSCTHLGVWSHPFYSLDGVPVGVPSGTSTSCMVNNLANPPCDADNRQVLLDSACTVANFRDRSMCADINNVWMKDTWNDTGLEPDPLTTGQKMWKSPYIWNRNFQAADGLEQHRHENPVVGQTNYLYVKVHNDFSTAASGQLKLYYAQFSTGLSWPNDWTEFSNQTVNIDANSTKISEAAWNPPGIGHVCLIARWDTPNSPSDPMTNPEGPDVKPNTRNNNNIIWRNVSAIPMESEQDMNVDSFIVRNTQSREILVDLVIEMPNTPTNFIRQGGRILFDLEGLFGVWRSNGAEGFGVEIVDDGAGVEVLEILDTATATATIGLIPMNPNQAETVHFSLRAPRVIAAGPFPEVGFEEMTAPDQPVTEYSLDVTQFENEVEVGGVGYEIRVTPEGPAGAVPDGGPRPGVPLTVDRLPNGDLVLSWGASCVSDDSDFAVYEGTLGDFVNHAPVVCTTGGLTTSTFPPTVGDKYYLVAPQSLHFEGSHGLRGSGFERFPGSLPCLPQVVAACP